MRESWVRLVVSTAKPSKGVGRVSRMLLRAARLKINEGSGFVCPVKCVRRQERTRIEEQVETLDDKQKSRSQEEGPGEGARLVLCLSPSSPQEVPVSAAVDLGEPLSGRATSQRARCLRGLGLRVNLPSVVRRLSHAAAVIGLRLQ